MDGYAGIDYGTKRVAYVNLADEVFTELLLSGSDNPAFDVAVIGEWLCDTVRTTRPTLIAVERPIQGASRNVRVGLAMAMVAGAITHAAHQTGSETILVEPATWKKAVVGRGNADKASITAWLQHSHSYYAHRCGKSQDLVDATCLALYAKKVLERRRCLP